MRGRGRCTVCLKTPRSEARCEHKSGAAPLRRYRQPVLVLQNEGGHKPLPSLPTTTLSTTSLRYLFRETTALLCCRSSSPVRQRHRSCRGWLAFGLAAPGALLGFMAPVLSYASCGKWHLSLSRSARIAMYSSLAVSSARLLRSSAAHLRNARALAHPARCAASPRNLRLACAAMDEAASVADAPSGVAPPLFSCPAELR